MPKLETPKQQTANVLPLNPPVNSTPNRLHPTALEVENAWKVFGADIQLFKGLKFAARNLVWCFNILLCCPTRQ